MNKVTLIFSWFYFMFLGGLFYYFYEWIGVLLGGIIILGCIDLHLLDGDELK